MSAIAELQHFLSQIPPPSSSSSKATTPPSPTNPIAIAHAALQHLRDSGDPTFLFLRTLIEISSDANHSSTHSTMDPHRQELLFHCVTGFRHVLLHKWSTLHHIGPMGREFCGYCRDYLMELGLRRSSNVSKAVGMACVNASASFWKRAWDPSVDTTNSPNAASSSSAEDAALANTLTSLVTMMNTSAPSLLQNRLGDKVALFTHLQTIITYPIQTVTDASVVPRSIMATSFLSTLMAEFAGTSRSTMSYYNLSLEVHRQFCNAFQEQFGLNQLLELSMNALSGAIQRLVQDSTSHYLMELAAAIISLLGETLSWDFHGGNWNGSQSLTSISTSSTLIRPPLKWNKFVINPDFLRALFSLYSSLQQSPPDNNSTHKLKVKHSIRQLILILSSLTGSIFPKETPETRKGYAEFLVDGTLTILSSILPSIQSNSQEHGLEVVDMCCILSRLISNFKVTVLSQLASFENLIIAISSVGTEILNRQLSECQRVGGDLDEILDDGWEWREEAWNHLMEGSVMISEDCTSFIGGGLNGDQREKALKEVLGAKLSAPLYSTYITTRIEMLRLEEHFLTKNADDVDEVREQITEVNLEEQMEAAASLGRLNVSSSIQCLTSIWGRISSRLHALFESTATSVDVSPDAAALLEEACLLITCLCHILTDDNSGETPLIPLTIIEACTNNDTTTLVVNMIHSVVQVAEYHIARVAQHPNNPNLSPFLGKTLLWFFHRWVSSYIIPPLSEYSEVGNVQCGILTIWSTNAGNESGISSVINFCVKLCLYYYCYWPQEIAVQRNATKLMLALAQRGVECRRFVMNTTPFEQLVALHAVTAGAWHGASDAELDQAISNYNNICQNLSKDLVKGYLRISYEGRGKVLQGILSCCCDDDQKAMLLYECCLRSVQSSFSNLVQALR